MNRHAPAVILFAGFYLVATLGAARPRSAHQSEEWTVTELTGEIVVSVSREPDMPEGGCPGDREVYRALAGDSYVYLAPGGDAEDFLGVEISYRGVVETIIDKFSDLPDGVRLTPDPDGDLFAFSFEFENGHHTNDPVLDANARAWEMGGMMGAASYYVGTWTQGSGEVFGIAAIEGPHIQEDGGTTGLSVFEVNGKLQEAGRISGTWRFREASSLMGCIQTSVGEGEWEAVPAQ